MNRTPAIPLHTARDSLRWIGKDVLVRLLPFAIVAFIWAYALAGGSETLKLSWRLTGMDFALILGTGIPAFAACTLFRARYWPIHSLASRRAHLIEDGYFLFFNAPAEELFFRGMLQSWAMALGFIPPAVGFVSVALVFGFYHRLAGFPLPFLLLATAGGFLFGILFLLSGTILTPIIVHFIADLALFNLGPTVLTRFGKIPYRVRLSQK
ncbi:MAG: type II CAAX endopeptidase family protein [Chloroflexota bacterium]|nr:type II CAAX endopeptidase family protein [Chloroflexota bacterium]MDE2931192.1 type II CAAX endopeptidase family protein [Chloroflexota bacterium]